MIKEFAEAVEWLEAEYEDWELVRCDYFDGLMTLRVRDADGWTVTGSYTQPMFKIKEDAVNGPTLCLACGSGEGHECHRCNEPITHMAGYFCANCWQGERS